MLTDYSLSDSNSPFDDHSSLEYLVNHVFFPVHHPKNDDYTPKNAHTLASAVHAAALIYDEHVVPKFHWLHTTRMLRNLQVMVEPAQPKELDRDNLIAQLGEMEAGGRLSGRNHLINTLTESA